MNQFSETLADVADGLKKQVATAPAPVERPTRRQYLAERGYHVWDAETPLDFISEDLEAGGYTREGAGSDFDRVCHAALALAAGDIEGLVLTGKTGCGKTTAASVIAKFAFTKIVRPDDPWVEDDLPLVETYDSVSCSHGNLGVVESHHLLVPFVLDDMGADRPRKDFGNETDPVGDFLVKWADAPAKKRAQILITTNLDAAGIKARYDDRVLSRLVERCGWLAMTAPDHRLAKLRKF